MTEKKDNILNILRLINTEGIGPVTFFKLLQKHKSLENVIEVVKAEKKFNLFSLSEAQKILQKAQEQNVELISYQDSKYPQKLLELNDAPPILYVKGDSSLLNHPLSVSIVGARNASINGRKTASRIAYDLTNNDILVISGMARGIDSAAHKGAMYARNQKGATLAVLGTGIDIPYPKENTDLYHQISEQGVLISELPFSTEPQAQNFPRRNRLVAALSSGTLVVEATLNSGSLITARLALEQGKDIFAVPGSPSDTRALGPNRLIKEGAVLIENADDILENLTQTHHQQITEYIDKLQKTSDIPIKEENEETPQSIDLTDYLSFDGVFIDELIRASGLEASEVSVRLLELEMSGKIERQPGNKVALIK